MGKLKKLTVPVMALLACLAANPSKARAVETPKPIVELRYNSLELGVQNDYASRLRLVSKEGLNLGPLSLNYHGLHELTSLDNNTYFGRNGIYLDSNDSVIKPCVVLKTDKTGIFSAGIGARNTSLLKLLGGSGFTEISFDPKSKTTDLAVCYIKNINDKLALEAFYNPKFKDGVKNYFEIGIYSQIAPSWEAFARYELVKNKTEQIKPTFLVGLRGTL